MSSLFELICCGVSVHVSTTGGGRRCWSCWCESPGRTRARGIEGALDQVVVVGGDDEQRRRNVGEKAVERRERVVVVKDLVEGTV